MGINLMCLIFVRKRKFGHRLVCTEKRPREDTRRLPAVTARKRSLKGSQSF